MDAFREEVESQDESPTRIQIELATDIPELQFAQVWWPAAGAGASFRVAGNDEAFVSHVATRVPELFAVAAKRLDAKRQPEPSVADREVAVVQAAEHRPSWLRRFLYDPWTVRVGGGLAVAAVIALIVALR